MGFKSRKKCGYFFSGAGGIEVISRLFYKSGTRSIKRSVATFRVLFNFMSLFAQHNCKKSTEQNHIALLNVIYDSICTVL